MCGLCSRLSGDLKMPFQLDRELYRKDDSAVHEALREVVNALVHVDHRGQGRVVIERYPDRIELSNPGSLLVSRVPFRPWKLEVAICDLKFASVLIAACALNKGSGA